jgi:CheY-like chemotaxis protein
MQDNHLILLVEDDENDVLLIQRAFLKAGGRFSLKTVCDGEQAIDYLSGKGVFADRQINPMPFLVLLDLRMPRKDGFEVLRWVRAESNFKRLLVVVLTSSDMQVDINRAYEMGANSYLVKPVEFSEMVNMVRRFEAYWSEINRMPSGMEALRPVWPERSLD